jgi:release factor glutamine methyltransferase
MQAGTPLAYLTCQQAFWSLDFKVNEHTLIPRPDTEVLVEQVLAWIAANVDWANSTDFKQNSLSNDLNDTNPQKPYQLLDLGTGSGCIAISLAHELNLQSPDWQVTAVDYSEGALDIAKQNAILNGTPDVNFIQSDWYNALPDEVKYQVIVSNPPYIDPVDKHLEQLSAEPLSALIADNQGLADIQKIVSGAVSYLVAGGLLAIEHGYDQGDAVQAIFTEAGFVKVQTIKDYGGNDRVTMGELASLK